MTDLRQWTAAGATHAGRRRGNEDSWGYSVEAGVFVVCDGMGGADGGAVASGMAAEAFLERLGAVPPVSRSPEAVADAVGAANRRVWARALAEPALRGMGTTLAGLALRGPREIVVAHVGDSRAYRFRRGVLERLTEDHSFVEEQVRAGVMGRAEAERSPMRNVITRAVGTRASVEASVRAVEVERGDVLLLCSDGVTKEIAEEGIAEVLGWAGSLATRAEGVISRALDAGGRDNATVVLVAVG